MNACPHVWAPGTETWFALAERGVWVEGCAEGLGFGALAPLFALPLLQLPPAADWLVFTHAGAEAQWPEGRVIATYAHGEPPPARRRRAARRTSTGTAARSSSAGAAASPPRRTTPAAPARPPSTSSALASHA